MSLRGRLILVALVVIVAVIASVQFTWYSAQERWARRLVPEHLELFHEYFLHFAYNPGESDGVEVVRRILGIGPDVFRDKFRDVFISNGPAPDVRGSVDLNPLGSRHRDPETFPLEEVRAGIRDAMSTQRSVLAATGYCLPLISSDGAEVVGGAWFEPIVPVAPRLPLSAYLTPIVLGALAFGMVAYALIERGVAKPLRDLGAAAQSVGAAEHGVQVPRLAGARELDRFIDAFNEMTSRIEGHRAELEREVKRATETAEKRQTALLRSARLASMGTLAAGIAHEINNPIGGMLNAIRRIGESDDLSERDRRYVGLIREGLERVGSIARRVLDFSPRKIEPVPFAIESAVEGARGLAEHRFREQQVELRLDLPESLSRLVGDEHEFQQVLLNVFINSLDVLQGRPGPRWIRVQAESDAAWTTIEIADNGPGMPRDDLAFVLDPFYSGKGRPDASGLGMFISHQIIENHGGQLEVDSELDEGFTVTIRMPVTD